VLEIIAKADNAGTVREVGRPAAKQDGPLTYARVLGEFIRRERLVRGWNQAELSKASGIIQSHISSFENGKKNISADNMDAILAAFEIDPQDVFLMIASMLQRIARDAGGENGEAPVERQAVPPGYVEDNGILRKVRASERVSEGPPTSRASR
jgi:transcriptional regulator with XRE-family HTH domain